MKSTHINVIKPGVILLGFIALVTQIILLREFLTFFNGNELVIGIILANWMLLTGLGAYIGRFVCKNKKSFSLIWILLGITGFLPVLTVLLLHLLWYFYFPPGIMAGIGHVFFYTLFILSPFCILSGMLFTLFAKEESVKSGKNKIGHIYAWESLGSLIGGALLNFVLIWVFSTFQSLFLIMLLITIVTILVCIKARQYFTIGILVFIVMGISFLFLENNLDENIRKLAFPGQTITYTKDSPFGIFVITKSDGQINYYENNVLMAASGDVALKEESVHFGMIQHTNPKNVLVISGIISGIMDEIIKYPVNSIDYIDINPEILKIARTNLDINLHGKLNLIEGDALRVLKNSKKKYDVVLINLPMPTTIQFNRYYTQEFFQALKTCLNNSSVISLSVQSSANYMNNEAKTLLSIIYKTLKSEFDNVAILPASKDFLIASNAHLSYDIAKMVEEKNIKTDYVNSFYFNDDLLQIRSMQLTDQLDDEVPINRDFSPVFYQSQIKLWMSYFNFSYWVPGLLILLFSGFFFIKAGDVYKGVFAAGFTGTSIEIVLLLVFQVVFGYVYIVAGIFIMIFMGGLAFGSYYMPKVFRSVDRRLFKKLQIGISIVALILPIIFILIKRLEVNDLLLFVLFVMLLFLISVLTGALFSVASKITKSEYGIIASNTYSLDLLGAATGALLFTIYLIPILGFSWSVVVVGIFNLLVAGFQSKH